MAQRDDAREARPVSSSVETEPLLHTVEDAARILAISTVTLRRLVWAGVIGHARIGRSVRVPADELRRFASKALVSSGGGR
jgi:excisionase family DNA binding protein